MHITPPPSPPSPLPPIPSLSLLRHVLCVGAHVDVTVPPPSLSPSSPFPYIIYSVSVNVLCPNCLASPFFFILSCVPLASCILAGGSDSPGNGGRRKSVFTSIAHHVHEAETVAFVDFDFEVGGEKVGVMSIGDVITDASSGLELGRYCRVIKPTNAMLLLLPQPQRSRGGNASKCLSSKCQYIIILPAHCIRYLRGAIEMPCVTASRRNWPLHYRAALHLRSLWILIFEIGTAFLIPLNHCRHLPFLLCVPRECPWACPPVFRSGCGNPSGIKKK